MVIALISKYTSKLRLILQRHPSLYSLVRNGHILLTNILYFPKRVFKSVRFKQYLISQSLEGGVIWYFCVPVHNNLGDCAQYYCILDWLSNNYPKRNIVEIPTEPIRYDYSGLLSFLKSSIKPDDLIVFQSGYTSSNIHPDEGVHRKIAEAFSNEIIFFPQTVKYTSPREAKKTASVYNHHGHITFLARDRISYEVASHYFSSVNVLLYPDIVTTLIGKRNYNYSRSGIAFCIRNDSEKKYSDKSIKLAFNDLASLNDTWTDTTVDSFGRCSEDQIEEKIIELSQHKVTITDRFHGTIMSLAASTPVIVLNTSDHKVSEGAEWFKKAFPEYIKVANNLDEAHDFAKLLLNSDLEPIMYPYFEDNYYKNLRDHIEKEKGIR